MCGSCRRTGSGVASRMCVSANERYCPTPPHPIKIYVFCWTVKSPSAQSRLHTDAFTQTLLHRDSFTHTHTNTSTHKPFRTQRLLHEVRAKGLPPDHPNSQKKTQFLTLEPRLARKGRRRTNQTAKNPQFLTLEPRFVRKRVVADIVTHFLTLEPRFVRKGDVVKSQFYPGF